MEDKNKLVEQIYKNMPYPEQIKDLDIFARERDVLFTWRGTRFIASVTFHVMQLEDGLQKGSNEAILVEEIIKRNRF